MLKEMGILHKKRRPWMNKLTIVIVVVGLLCSGAILAVDQYFPSEAIEAEITEAANRLAKYDQEYEIGDLVKIGGYDITIHSAEYLTHMSDSIIQPKPEYAFYNIEATIQNNTDQVVDGRVLFATKLYVEDTFYDIEYNPPVLENTLKKSIVPGEEVSGNIIFQIPKEAESIELVYMSTVWDYRKIINLDK